MEINDELIEELVDPIVNLFTENKVKYESEENLNLPGYVPFRSLVEHAKKNIISRFASDISQGYYGEQAPLIVYFLGSYGLGTDYINHLTEVVEERFKIAGF